MLRATPSPTATRHGLCVVLALSIAAIPRACGTGVEDSGIAATEIHGDSSHATTLHLSAAPGAHASLEPDSAAMDGDN